MELHKWNKLIWGQSGITTVAYCPNHKGMELDVIDRYRRLASQSSLTSISDQNKTVFVCPVDEEQFEFPYNYYTLVHRYNTFLNSRQLKSAKIVELDNVYTPILTVSPKPKDDRYSIQVEVDETPQGKKLVIYAADRKAIGDKTQIFIDPQVDKITFDGGDVHPNAIFSKVVAYFKDGKSVTLESDSPA